MLKRYTVTIGLGALAVVLAIVGAIVYNQSSFAVNTVHSQLAAQGIRFTPVSGLILDPPIGNGRVSRSG